MSEVRIARFVDMQACKSIFSDDSTFVLRSAEHYRRKHETLRGDERELEVKLTGGGSAQTSHFVLSCWTMLNGDEPTREEWNIVEDSVLAIVSTPSKVSALLKRAFEIEDATIQNRRRFPFICVDHKPVRYADEVPEEITFDNIMEITVFTKRLKFAHQKEYRFALPYSSPTHLIDTYIFAMAPDDYMEKCFVNPEMIEKDKQQLQQIIQQLTDGYGHFEDKQPYQIIANIDVLF